MPETTSDEADHGVVGLTVVFARLKETTPEMLTAAPRRTRPAETTKRPAKSKAKDGVAQEASHMIKATNRPCTTGGTRKSSEFVEELFWFNCRLWKTVVFPRHDQDQPASPRMK